MLNYKFMKSNVSLAMPILFSSLMVVGCAIINASIVGYSDPSNWYLLGMYLPINYLVLGILESGRVCGITSVTSSTDIGHYFIRGLVLALYYAVPFLVGALCVILLWSLKLNLFGVKTDLFKEYSFFSSLFLLTYIVVSTNSIFNATLFGLKQGKIASFIIILTSLISILLTYVCSKYLNLGLYSIVLGIGIAYLLGCAMSFLTILDYSYNLEQEEIIFPWKDIFNLIKSPGVPVFLTYLSIPIGVFIITQVVSKFGVAAISGFGLAYRIQNIFILPAISLGVSAGIYINQLKLNNVREKYTESTILLSLMFYLPASLLLYFFRTDISMIFTADKSIQVVIAQYISCLSWAYIFFCPLLSLITIWEQTGAPIKSLVSNIFVLILQIILAGGFAVYFDNLKLFFQLSALIMILYALILLLKNLSWNFKITNFQEQPL